jgi:hypothetical protein
MSQNDKQWWHLTCQSASKSIKQTREWANGITLARRARDGRIDVDGPKLSCTAIVGSHTKIKDYYTCSFELDMSTSPVTLTKHGCGCKYK